MSPQFDTDGQDEAQSNEYRPELKKVKLRLEGLDGNAFNLMGAFRRQAQKEGWTKEEIQKVLDKCMESDYDNLLCTLIEHSEAP